MPYLNQILSIYPIGCMRIYAQPCRETSFQSNSLRTFDQSKTNHFGSGESNPNVNLQFHSNMSICQPLIKTESLIVIIRTEVLTEFVKFCPKNDDCKYLNSCKHFRNLKIPFIREHGRKHHLCFNCLGSHMFKDFPWDKSCNECSGKHHTLLNEDNGTRVINKNTSSKIVQITGGTR